MNAININELLRSIKDQRKQAIRILLLMHDRNYKMDNYILTKVLDAVSEGLHVEFTGIGFKIY